MDSMSPFSSSTSSAEALSHRRGGLMSIAGLLSNNTSPITAARGAYPTARGRTFVIAVIPLLASLYACRGGPFVSSSTAGQQVAFPVVATTGEAVIRKAADVAFVEVAVESLARTPKEARSKNAEIMAAVRKRLREAGITEEAIRTLSYYLEADYDYVKGNQVLRGYAARNAIEVRIEQMDRIGEVIDLSIAAGANSVASPRFDLKDREAIEHEALKQAVADALAKAEAAAAGAHRAVDRVLRIEERGMSPKPLRRPLGLTDSAREAPETTIVPGEIEINAQVMLTAALK